ncbi:MAG TPA: Stp1/IreP family PP2C-type Ser/Thr phosphatase [Candidatus Binataceae bacterium]|nr:Stp1/IreP family PP2C-type Ser/Thr phosphatase [Candidatus Binataceae bacterium]
MITCPECGQAAPDDAKFCDRCGQGLAKSAAPKVEYTIDALSPGAVVGGEFRIVEVLGRAALENRYRAERPRDGAGPQRVQLRERPGPTPAESAHREEPAGASNNDASPREDPTGPHAKTAELKPPAPQSPADASATAGAIAGASGAADGAIDGATAAGSNGAGVASERSVPAPASQESVVAVNEAANNEGAQESVATRASGATEPLTLDETMGQGEAVPPPLEASPAPAASASENVAPQSAAGQSAPGQNVAGEDLHGGLHEGLEDLGDLFGRVLALSLTINHPAFQRASDGFAEGGRVYLVYPDEQFTTLAQRRGGLKMSEGEALSVAIQVCQAVSFLNRRGLRLNDICPQSIAYGAGARVKLLGLDYVSNDTELQGEPIFNDGYTAPEVYRGKRVDKRADVFSIGALLYSCLTGERLESESWREEAGPVRFYPPHVVSPELEQVVRRALLFDPQGRWPTVDALKAELVRLSAAVRIRAAVMTDVGMVREHNEDATMAVEFVRQTLVEPAESYLYVVADGMGGAEAGEVASAIAVGAIRNYVESGLASAEAQNPNQLLTAALEEANRKIIEYQAAHPESRGMGSTAVSVLIVPPEAAVAWVGDSRVYLSDASGLRQLTRDHSLVQRLIEIGQITPEEARHHEHKNVITRSLGARQSGPAGAEGIALRLKRGDRVMLCSDGLTAHVEDRTIGEVLRRYDDPNAATRELVVAANAGGGTDNVSVIVVFAD